MELRLILGMALAAFGTLILPIGGARLSRPPDRLGPLGGASGHPHADFVAAARAFRRAPYLTAWLMMFEIGAGLFVFTRERAAVWASQRASAKISNQAVFEGFGPRWN